MPATQVSKKFSVLAANGGTDGTVQIIDTTGWLPGAKVILRDDNTAPIQCKIVEVLSSSKLRLRADGEAAQYGFTADLSAYTVAQNASLAMEQQVVVVRQLFIPVERA